jgi:hypothetical protein
MVARHSTNPQGYAAFSLRATLVFSATCLALWLAGSAVSGSASGWPRFEDDAYYYLVIARNVAAGQGFTADGIAATNGFQPLWMWLLIPLAWLTSGDTAQLLAAAQVAIVAIFCASAGLLAGFLRARFGAFAACIGLALLLVPRFSNVPLSGMESGLAIAIFVCLVRELSASGVLERVEPAAADARAGVLFGLLLLARLDSVFAAAACAAYAAVLGLASGDRPLPARVTRLVRKGLATFWPAVALVAPYLAWNWLVFGHVVPISGALKTSHSQPSWNPTSVNPWFLLLLGLAFLAAALELRRPDGRALGRLLAVLAGGLALQALHALVFMHWAVFAWHYALAIPVGAIALAALAREAQERLPAALLPWAIGGAVAVVAATQAIAISRLHLTFTGASREAGEWVAKSLPPDAVLAMKDSGAFSYFARRRVVNLDGVVNSFEFEETLCRGELREYLARHGVAYVAQHAVPDGVRAGDYETHLQIYGCHFAGGRDSELSFAKAREVYRSTPYRSYQGAEDQLIIWGIGGVLP